MADETSAATAAPTVEAPATSDVNAAFTSALSELPDYQYLKAREAKETPVETKSEPAPEAKETPKEATETTETTEETVETTETTESTEATEEVDDAPSKDPKAQARWSELKKELKALKAEKEAFTQKEELIRQEAIKEVQAKLEQIQKEHDALKQEREEIDKELYLSRVEATREFKTHVTEPLNQTFAQVEALAKQYKIDPNNLVDALYKDVSGDASALDEILTDVPERHRSKVYALSDNLMQIENRRADLKENAKVAYQTAIEKEKAERESYISKITETRTKELDTLTSKFSEKVSTLVGDDVKIDYDAIKRDAIKMDEWDESTKMYSGVAAVVLPEILKALEKTKSELTKIRSENIKLRGGSPKTQSGHTASSPADVQPKVDYSKMTWDQMAKGAAERLVGMSV